MAGLTSIRAYGAEEAFRLESRKLIDGYTRPARAFWDLNRLVREAYEHIAPSQNDQMRISSWICIRIDALGGIFAAGLAAYLVYGRSECAPHHVAGYRYADHSLSNADPDASIAGFSLTMALSFTHLLLYWVRVLNSFQVEGEIDESFPKRTQRQ